MILFSRVCVVRSIWAVTILSIPMLVLGFVTLVYGIFQVGLVTKNEKIDELEIPYLDQSGLGIGVMILGAFTVLLGILGFLSARSQKCIFTGPFIIFAFITGLILFIISILVLGYSSEIGDKFQKVGCNALNNETAESFTKRYDEHISRWVCSEECPCW